MIPRASRSDGTLIPDYRRKLQVLLSQYYKEMLGCEEPVELRRQELKFRRSIEPLPTRQAPPAPSSGDGHDDDDVRPQRQPGIPRQGGRGGWQGGLRPPAAPDGAGRRLAFGEDSERGAAPARANESSFP